MAQRRAYTVFFLALREPREMYKKRRFLFRIVRHLLRSLCSVKSSSSKASPMTLKNTFVSKFKILKDMYLDDKNKHLPPE